MKLSGYIIGGLMAFVLILAFQTWRQDKRITELSSDNARLENNQKQLLAEKQAQIALILTKDELAGQYLTERDSLAKLLKIRPKTITKIVEKIITQIERDTVEVESTWLQGFTWGLVDTGDCFRWEAQAELNGLDLDVNRTLFDYNNKSIDLFYWERKKILFLRIGKKEYFQKQIPQCGTTIERSIEIVKK